jgi:hypothetical protein
VNARRCFLLAVGVVVLFSVGRAFRLHGVKMLARREESQT